jgi:Tripartite tricarboxylate transporter TctB family
MRCSGRAVFSLFLVAVAAVAVGLAWRWPFKAAFFPLAVGLPLLALASVQLVLDLRGRGQPAAGPAVDLEFASEVPPEVARRRAGRLFAWIAGFIALVFLVGFPIAVPVFMGAYLLSQRAAAWWLSLGLAAVAWAFFHGVFQWLLRLPFEPGWLQTRLGW